MIPFVVDELSVKPWIPGDLRDVLWWYLRSRGYDVSDADASNEDKHGLLQKVLTTVEKLSETKSATNPTSKSNQQTDKGSDQGEKIERRPRGKRAELADCVRIFQKYVREDDKRSMKAVVKDYAEENGLNAKTLYRETNDDYSVREGRWKAEK